ncbi:SdpI family protein [Tenacibaculum maritimum]|uniref:SdpI/YhfL protein family n=1 Tax=Tenacibaculum maritimum NCIMB 2154 TaxID=1349785 RepID=A0A2H1EDD4_9FLAO|nr:SdpI family protein [Tenacibaculum maritimum]MCD9562099.1 SdpI family protein [Tenacibaculum maritimum]MCD9565618.1 SdpI family protein [Tenacibaculum maritimum]MCD9578487.1 SdpI family protein [Tenacibaculum maritimum]MCD9584676.1 SdpI family protein [Tenacibaculum maritimum]MCD9596456.1 SdpI family protein [Tenacibaculum maritimum]
MNPYYYVLSVNGLLFALSIVFYFFPPKKINSIYGYRTNKAMKNDTVWKYANSFFNKQFLIYSAISFVSAMLFVYLNPNINWQPMAIMILSLAVSVIKTEQELNKNFDDEGNKL